MPSSDDAANVDSIATRKAFCRKVFQNALIDRVDQRIDALYARAFQEAGMLENVNGPPLSVQSVVVLKSTVQALGGPDGPLLFVRYTAHAEVIEVFELLLNADREIRVAALDYLNAGASQSKGWLTPQTQQILNERASLIRSDQIAQWRRAAVEVVPILRSDLFGALAALRQSLVNRYKDGIDQFLPMAMRPSLNSLAPIRPPLWSPTLQRSEIRSLIQEVAGVADLANCLSAYCERFGYLPLGAGLDSVEVVERWLERNAAPENFWETIWNWSKAQKSPFAKYHAIQIALAVPGAQPPEASGEFWKEVTHILDVRQNEDSSSAGTALWQLFCELAVHFVHHIEALHPGQDSERVACYAWWLAQTIGEILVDHDMSTTNLLEHVRSEGNLSFSRWTVARSQVSPSVIRYATLFNSSIWAMSLLQRLTSQEKLSIPTEMVDVVTATITGVLGGYLIASPLSTAVGVDEKVYAFQDNSHFATFRSTGSQNSTSPQNQIQLAVQYRDAMLDPATFKNRLDSLLELPPLERRLTLLFLDEAVFSSARHDRVVADWLADAARVVRILLEIPDDSMFCLMEALHEYQQRNLGDWAVRLPHFLAYAIEQTYDEKRMQNLVAHTAVMSINAGIVSPIQRLLVSKWRADIGPWMENWRDTLFQLIPWSEPWVGARIRGTSATISRALGPRKQKLALAGTSAESTDASD